ncbi:MAG: DUF5906 domain-containing protein [Deltaproteobacteria bacterium]|nr:DUF5906 domain-containing protein [Deltaproteobacteria bacterium]
MNANHRVKLYPENVPPALIAIPQWVNYKRVPKEKDPTKWDKIPLAPKGNGNASVKNPKTWGTYQQALERYEKDQNVSGIGIVLKRNLGIAGVDLDGCLAEDGTPLWGEDVIENLDTYSEISPSGRGCRSFAYATLPPKGRKKDKIEMYDDGRFLTVTGNVIGKRRSIEKRQAEVTSLHEKVFGRDESSDLKGKTKKIKNVQKKEMTQRERVSPEEERNVIEIIERSKQAPLFKKFMDGKWSEIQDSGKQKYPSQSEADMAFLGILAFFTRKNATLMKSIFSKSKMHRDKCSEAHDSEEDTYLDMTIAKAIDGCEETYDPQYKEHRLCTDQELQECIRELNRKHSVVMIGGKCLILNEVRDPVFDRPNIDFSSTRDFCTRYRNQRLRFWKSGHAAEKSVADIWLDSPDRREYDGVVFDPSGKATERYYNLFRGFPVVPKPGSWERMQEHIFEVICNRHDESYRYTITWLARMVQDPGGKRPGVVIVLRGRQGTGKGCFVNSFGEIFGSHFLHIISSHLVGGRFNSFLKDALLVFVDEGFWGGDKQAEGVLKGMITEDFIMVEPKGKEAFRIQNNTNFIFASNGDWVVPAGPEERRFFVMDVSERRMGDNGYFTAIYEEMDNGGREAMLYDLLHHDISNVNLRKFPRSEALLDQIIHSMPTVKKFWYELLREGRITTTVDRLKQYSTETWPNYIITANLYDLYCEFATRIGDRYKLIDTQFGKQIREICSGIVRKKKDHDWCLYFPTLLECRRNFEKLVNIKVEWGSEG